MGLSLNIGSDIFLSRFVCMSAFVNLILFAFDIKLKEPLLKIFEKSSDSTKLVPF